MALQLLSPKLQTPLLALAFKRFINPQTFKLFLLQPFAHYLRPMTRPFVTFVMELIP